MISRRGRRVIRRAMSPRPLRMVTFGPTYSASQLSLRHAQLVPLDLKYREPLGIGERCGDSYRCPVTLGRFDLENRGPSLAQHKLRREDFVRAKGQFEVLSARVDVVKSEPLA